MIIGFCPNERTYHKVTILDLRNEQQKEEEIMVTKVGLQQDIFDALKDLIELDLDAIEAYDAALNRLEDSSYKTTMSGFKDDHHRHVKEFSDYLIKHKHHPPQSGDLKKILTQGKVIISELFGDNAIIGAMKSNEVDTKTAYKRMLTYEGIDDDLNEILQRGFNDERRHLAWMETHHDKSFD